VTDRLPATPEGIARAAEILTEGGLVAFPTDTVHGVACRPDDPHALESIFLLKRRPAERRIPMLVPSLAAAQAMGYLVDDRARRLAERHWPGPLTLVLPRSAGDGESSQAFRAPSHPTALALLAATGPLMTTSANISGQPECWTTSDVLVAFAGTDDLLDAVIEGDSERGVASSVVDLTGPGARLVREGALTREELVTVVELEP
jgi:L-threonylcarbamoyladenylate synthase